MRDRTQITHMSGVLYAWCEFCGRAFWTHTARNRHIINEHRELIPCEKSNQQDAEN